MYFAYIDESGKPELTHSQNEFIISALIIHEKEWFNIQNACDELKANIWRIMEKEDEIAYDFEVHIKEINNNEKYYNSIRPNKKLQILKEIYTAIGDLNASIVSIVILKDKVQNQPDINDIAFKLLFEKLQQFMDQSNPHQNEYLLLILDRVSPHFDDSQRKKFESFVKFGVKRTKKRKRQDISSIIETPFFVSSNLHNAVQFSDAIAFLIRRYVHVKIHGKSSSFWDKNVEPLMQLIGKRYYKDNENRVCENGLKIYPNNYETYKPMWDCF